MRRTKEDSEQTKSDLMRVAVKVFNEKGYASTRLEDVAKAAGVTRGAIYYHFGSKSEIFKAIVHENKDQTMKMMSKIMEEHKGSSFQGLKSVFKKYLSLIENNSFFRDVETLIFKTELTGELADLESLFKFDSNEGFCRLKDILRDCVKEGSMRPDLDIDSFAFALLSYHYGIMSLWIVNKDIISLKEKCDDFSNYIFEYCKKK